MPTPDPRAIVELANEIIATENQLVSLNERWEKLFQGSPVPQIRNNGGRPPREDSTASQVLRAIRADGSRDWNAQEMSDHLQVNKQQVESALYNLFVAKKIDRIDRGRYTVANPYADQIEAQIELEKKSA